MSLGKQKWSRLIRFVSDYNHVYYGDAIGAAESIPKQAVTIIGNPFQEGYAFGPARPIRKLLAPIAPGDVGTLRLLGLNFRKHAAETGQSPPRYPVVFHKPITCIGGPTDTIPVPPMAQAGGAVDYEVELVAVIGKACRNVSAANALDYVAGYTVGNDMSQRVWQMERGGGQWNVSKSFDGWAPIGPEIISPELAPKPENWRLTSKVNGELRQSEVASDMIYNVADAIEFLSAGQTLLPGDLLFMGTPAGVGMGFKPQPKWLKHNDVVECSISGIGTIVNKVDFSKAESKL